MLKTVDDPRKLRALRDRAIQLIGQHRKPLAYVFLAGLVLGAVYAHFLRTPYVVSMTVTAARYTSDTKPITETSALSLLTRPDAGELSDFALYAELLTSVTVAQEIYQTHPELVLKLFANEWHGVQWGAPRTFKQAIKTVVFGIVGADPWTPPDPWRLSAVLSSMVHMEKNGRSPIARVTVRAKDRALGIDLLYAMHEAAESVLKSSALKRSEEKAKYLQSVAETTPSVAISESIRQSQLRSRVSAALSSSPVPFGAEFISAPGGPARPSQMPKLVAPFLIAIVFTLVAIVTIFLNQQLNFARQVPKVRDRLRRIFSK